MRIERYGRYWAVYDALGVLVCVTVYKKGAREVVKRLEQRVREFELEVEHLEAVFDVMEEERRQRAYESLPSWEKR